MSLPPLSLREPSQRVSPRAPMYWRIKAALVTAASWLAASTLLLATLFGPAWPYRLGWLGVAALLTGPLPWLTIAPRIRYAVHRWEVTGIAVHVRYGWLSRTDEIVPLSRVQTVDSAKGPLMRILGLRTVTVKTASQSGTVAIACLDEAVAQRLVAQLVAITSATPEDAT